LFGSKGCQTRAGLTNRVRERGFSFVLTSVRNSDEIVKSARIEIYAFIANRWFMVRVAADNAKL
jgi:hypothetical protein